MQRDKRAMNLRVWSLLLIGVLLPTCMYAQQILVKGIVKDRTGETVIGASVLEKGTQNGTITGLNGDF